MSDDPIARLRALCLSLPRVSERTSYSQPAWFAGTKLFAMLDWRRPAVWVAAPPGVQVAKIAEDKKKYFRPPYLGPKGYVGVYLDVPHDWEDVVLLVKQGHTVARG